MENRSEPVRKYPPLRPKPPGPAPWTPAAFAWLRPLLNRWGIAGVIIFIGLFLSLVERPASWLAKHAAPPIAHERTQ
jgi:hypothetical protein